MVDLTVHYSNLTYFISFYAHVTDFKQAFATQNYLYMLFSKTSLIIFYELTKTYFNTFDFYIKDPLKLL